MQDGDLVPGLQRLSPAEIASATGREGDRKSEAVTIGAQTGERWSCVSGWSSSGFPVAGSSLMILRPAPVQSTIRSL